MATALWSADSLMKLLHAAGGFLTPAEQEQKVVVGELFMNTYVRLAAASVENNKRMWHARPKLHMLHHIIIQDRASMRNPVMNSCWMDEDAIKRFFRVKKRTHRRNATFNSLRRWLLGLPGQFEKAVKDGL